MKVKVKWKEANEAMFKSTVDGKIPDYIEVSAIPLVGEDDCVHKWKMDFVNAVKTCEKCNTTCTIKNPYEEAYKDKSFEEKTWQCPGCKTYYWKDSSIKKCECKKKEKEKNERLYCSSSD